MIQQTNISSLDRLEQFYLLKNFKEVKLKCQTFLRPRLRPDIINWLEENLILPDSFPIPGPFRIRNSPHLEEPLRKALDPEVRSLALMGGNQMGKTLLFICVWAYDVVNDPCPYLYANATDDGVKKYALQKLEPIINCNPILNTVIAKKRRGNTDESSTRWKIYPGGWKEMISLASRGKTRFRSARKTVDDDMDEIKITLGSEGNAHSNLKGRVTAYKYNYQHYFGSTPRRDGSSYIQLEFKEGSQANWYVVCPGCKKELVLDEDRIVWDKEPIDLLKTEFHNDFKTARIKCDKCEYQISEAERMEMLLKGRWIHKYPSRTDHLSYQLGKASSTIASLSFIAEQKYLAEKAFENGDDSLYESYMNNEKGLPYKKIVIKEIDARKLIDRREDYIDPEKKNIIPNGVLILTAFVDAQAGSQTKPARYEGEVWGWGVGEECWMVDRFKIEGNPEDRNVRDKLKNFLNSLEYVRKDGLKRTIRRIGVDAGWASQSIYELVERGWDKWCATKGSNNIRASLLPRKISLVNNDKSVLINVGTQAAKHTLFLRLQEIDETEINIKPNLTDKETEEKKEFIAKIHHTKLFCDLDYFEQLTAEHAVPIIRQNETHYVFQKKKSGLANEAIDIWCGAYAMMKSLNVNWRKYKASVDAKVGALSNQEETTADTSMTNLVMRRMKPAAPLELTKVKTKNKNVIRRPSVNPITNYG